MALASPDPFRTRVLVDDLIGRYQQMKKAHGLLDFDDLIVRTVMIARRGRMLDHGYSTSSTRASTIFWSMRRRIRAPTNGASSVCSARNFSQGRPARTIRRTLFAVGDEKQSIYSFQGAVPEDFAEHGRATERKTRQSELSFAAGQSQLLLPVCSRCFVCRG